MNEGVLANHIPSMAVLVNGIDRQVAIWITF